jgi:hypothetical protein
MLIPLQGRDPAEGDSTGSTARGEGKSRTNRNMWIKRKRENLEALRAFLRENGGPPMHLSGPARSRILREALSGDPAREGGEERVLRGLHRLPALSLAAAAVALLILAAGFLAPLSGIVPDLPLFSPQAMPGPSDSFSDPVDFSLEDEDGQVILTWDAEEGRTYAIRQGHSVAEAWSAPAVLVKGSRYVAGSVPEPGRAVFYVVQ